MRNHKKWIPLLLLGFLLIFPVSTLAVTDNSLDSYGKIGFYGTYVEPGTPTPPDGKKPIEIEPVGKKPTTVLGNLPQTNEQSGEKWMLLGLVVLFFNGFIIKLKIKEKRII